MSGLYSDLPEVTGAGAGAQPSTKPTAWAGGATAASLVAPAVARPAAPAPPKPGGSGAAPRPPVPPLPPPPPGPPPPAAAAAAARPPPSSAAALLFGAGEEPEEEGGRAEGEYDPSAPNSYAAVIAARAAAAGEAAAAAATAGEAAAAAAAAAAVTAVTGEPAGVERGLPLAARLMEKMGWKEGEGLGAREGRKGMTAPLVARKTGTLAATIGVGSELRLGLGAAREAETEEEAAPGK